jgi:DHA1 family tetracycline resistance protein-like MFS transporter
MMMVSCQGLFLFATSFSILGMLILGVVMFALGPFALLYVQLRPTASPFIYYSARAMHGIVNWMAIALSAMADVLPPRLRAPGVGVLMGGFWFGLCMAPSLAIFLDHLQVIVLACSVQLCGLVCAIMFFPETLPPHVAEEARRRHAQTLPDPRGRIVWTVSRPLRELSIVNRNGFFRLLSALAFFNGMVTAGDKTLLLYYVDSALSFSAKDVAIMFLIVGFTAVIAQVIILKPLNDCIGERLIIIVCFIASVFSNTIYGLARNRQTLYAGICLGALTGMAFPTISAIKANNVVGSCKTCAERKISVF